MRFRRGAPRGSTGLNLKKPGGEQFPVSAPAIDSCSVVEAIDTGRAFLFGFLYVLGTSRVKTIQWVPLRNGGDVLLKSRLSDEALSRDGC